MTLSEYIVEYRNSHDMSQRQFAKQCGLTNGYINMLENGINPKTNQKLVPSITTFKKIASGTGKSLQDLLSMIEDSPVRIDVEIGTPIKMDDSILRLALYGDTAPEVTKEDLQKIREFALFIRERKQMP